MDIAGITELEMFEWRIDHFPDEMHYSTASNTVRLR